MVTIDIDIENYIDEIDDYFLIKELKHRADNGNKKAKDAFKESIKEVLVEDDEAEKWPEIKTISD